MNSIINVIKGVVQREAARLVAYSSMAAVAAALALANHFGVNLSEAFIAAVGVFATALATELIRHFVYSENTVKEMVGDDADGPA